MACYQERPTYCPSLPQCVSNGFKAKSTSLENRNTRKLDFALFYWVLSKDVIGNTGLLRRTWSFRRETDILTIYSENWEIVIMAEFPRYTNTVRNKEMVLRTLWDSRTDYSDRIPFWNGHIFPIILVDKAFSCVEIVPSFVLFRLVFDRRSTWLSRKFNARSVFWAVAVESGDLCIVPNQYAIDRWWERHATGEAEGQIEVSSVSMHQVDQ